MDEVVPNSLPRQLRLGERLSLIKIFALKFSLKCCWEIENDHAGRAYTCSDSNS